MSDHAFTDINPTHVPHSRSDIEKSAWVWIDNSECDERRRVDRVLFCRKLNSSKNSEKALLHLSARLQYHLRVNGRMIGYGPARTYPEFHEFDIYDLRDSLVEGANILEVEVLHWNLTTFHGLLEAPGFIASGEVLDGSGILHSLETPGKWQCQRMEGVDASAPRLSFAQGPVEFVDLRKTSGTIWHTPVVTSPAPISRLRERALPPLTQTEIPAASFAVASVVDDEIVVGGRVVCDGVDKTNPFPPRENFAILSTWIHSDSEQRVPAGIWWGEYHLNGTALLANQDPRFPLRNAIEIPLRAGWNKLIATQGLAFGFAEFCLAVPTQAGLRFKIAPYDAAEDGLRLAGPFGKNDFTEILYTLKTASETRFNIPWQHTPLIQAPPSPLRHLAWSRTQEPLSPAQLPITINPETTTLITIDMGGLVLGRLFVDIEAPAGTVLDVAHAEAARQGRVQLDKTVVMYSADRWIHPGGRRRIESFSPRGFRHLDVLICSHSASVTLHAAGVVEQRYPYEFTGTFACSDDDFNRLWFYGQRTLELCSEDVYTDCPWRERTLYGGDLLSEMATTAVLSKDLRLVRQSLEVLLQSLNEKGWLQSRAPAPREDGTLYDYPLLTSIAIAWYVRLSSDDNFARRAWPVFKTMADAVSLWRRKDGLYNPPIGAFIDHGRAMTQGPTCAFNSALTAAFRAWSEISRIAGASVEANDLSRLGDELDSQIANAFFDAKVGSFRDLPLVDGGCKTEGTPPNTWPLLFCRSAQVQAPAALAAITRTLATYTPDRESESVSPYQMFYLLSALRRHGCAELAETTIRRVYALMLDNPSGTLWEHSRATQSLVHAWSSGINTYFATAILGVDMGFDAQEKMTSIRLAPCAASITWARGRVPHPLGNIDVAWERRDDGLYITHNAPDGVPVTLAPAGPLAALPCFVNGSPSNLKPVSQI